MKILLIGSGYMGLEYAKVLSAGGHDFEVIGRDDATARKFEIETGDDFALTSQTSITGATFTGLLTGGSTPTIGQIVVEIYRVFPNDSNVGRTSGVPVFSTAQVPTRVN